MNKINFRAVLFLLNLSLVLQTGCKQKAAEQPPEELSEPFQITITESGGFTGGTEGYTISSSGKIEKFRQMPGGEKSVIQTTMTKTSQVNGYRVWLENSGLLQETLNEKGNMTTTVRYETADTSYVWSFPAGGRSGSPVVKKLNNWCSEVSGAVKIKK